jgi:DNA-binding transcriptional LysR family regulator
MNWDDLRFLIAIHRHRSHARVAHALGVDATTVGRKLRALEGAMGARLVRRVADGHALTPAAEALLPSLEQIELHAIALERRARGNTETVGGTVRLSASDGLMSHVLVPGLPRLRVMNPELRVDLVPELEAVDLARHEADVALRLSRLSSRALVARRLATLTYGVYAGESYLRVRRPPAALDDLAAHDWVGYVQEATKLRPSRWLWRYVPRSRVAVRATTTTAVLHACAAGLGLAILLTCIADGDPRLVRVLPQSGMPGEAFVVHHQEDKDSAKVRVTVEWLKEILAAG